MKRILKAMNNFFKEIFLGFKIAEELKKKSTWGKF